MGLPFTEKNEQQSNAVGNILVDAPVVTMDVASPLIETCNEDKGYESDTSSGENEYELERMNYVRHLANNICLRTLPTQMSGYNKNHVAV